MSQNEFTQTEKPWIKWLAILGSIGSIIGIPLAFYFYFQTQLDKNIRLKEATTINQVLNLNEIYEPKIKVLLTETNEQINDNIFLQSFYLWNNGDLAITKKDILDSLMIKIKPNVKIIDYSVLYSTRKVCDIELSKTENKNLKLNFSILEKDDGFIGQVMYMGVPPLDLTISGNIVGIRKLNSESILEKDDFYFKIKMYGIFIIVYLILIYSLFNFGFSNREQGEVVRLNRSGFVIFFTLFMIFTYLWFFKINVMGIEPSLPNWAVLH